jgi:Asp-tRNA(Asn)/Glu-tRNA(Gln) amidotransferase A subunit family amidase
LTSDFKGRKIGIVKEGFGHPTSEADVDSLVLTAAKSMEQVGAIVEEVSIPMHLDGNLVMFQANRQMDGQTNTQIYRHRQIAKQRWEDTHKQQMVNMQTTCFLGPVLFDVIAMEGLTETMFKGHG